ncbi:MAG: hypothetical protein JWM53_1555 [bacterium]|nr:hypothetical protein [bacterium]
MSGERLHILVLDDDPAIIELIEDVLGAECAITVANTIDEASAALEVGYYDILLCDLMTDGVVSTAFLDTVAARHPALRRVLMSGCPTHEWQGMLDRSVVVAALSKPFELTELWAVIRSNE